MLMTKLPKNEVLYDETKWERFKGNFIEAAKKHVAENPQK